MADRFTPGPWDFVPDPGAECHECGESHEEAFLVGPQMPTGVGIRTGLAVVLPGVNAAQDARLIAAAPDMLDKLTYLHQLLCLQPAPKLGEWNWPQIAADVKAVIEKATGQ